MRLLTAVGLVATLSAAACGGSSSMPASPSALTTMAGTWFGSVSDSTGSMMGAGMSGAMMGSMTWQVTQTGNTFSGTMQFPGYQGGTMMVSGSLNGKTGTLTMTMPMGSTMTGGCSATGTGTFDMDDTMTQMHGTYVGTNSCSGPFDHGQISLVRR